MRFSFLVLAVVGFGSDPEATENFDLIRTEQHRLKALTVQELNNSWLFRRFGSSGQVINCYDNVEVPLYLGPGTSGKWVTRGDKLPDDGDSKLGLAYFSNRYLVIPTGNDFIDDWENEGNSKALFQLKDYKQAEAALAHFRAMSYAVWRGVGGREPDGLNSMLEKAPPSAQVGVIGGISKAAKPWWRNQYIQLNQNFGYIGPNTTLPAGVLAAFELIDACTIGSYAPTDLATGKDVWRNFRRYERENQTQAASIQTEVNAKRGVNSFSFEGLELSWDHECPDDSLYCFHLHDRFRPMETGANNDTKFATDFESVATNSYMKLEAGLFSIINPNVRMRTIEARSGYRSMSETRWSVDSWNLGCDRPSDNGVAGSDNGKRWSTWS